jgi:tetraacyldisaccharide 4'-kinase
MPGTDLETAWRDLISGRKRVWWAPVARAGLGALSGIYAGVVTAYRAGFDVRLFRTSRLPCPVVGVGNLTVGGTGKTTTVRWIARRLVEWGMRPAILSYGYRAGSREPVTVVAGPDGIREPVQVSGDEAQLLARSLPGVPLLIGRKRVLSGRRAWEEFHAGVCLLDDAFQYWRLEKDLELVLVDATNPFGYGRLLPRGMLREPLRGLRRAHAAIMTHADRVDEAGRESLRRDLCMWNPRLILAEAAHRPVCLRDHRNSRTLNLDILQEGRWLALSSLGQPESFERTLADLGAVNALPVRFRDHHPYTEPDLRRVCERVGLEGLSGIVTTEKDSVKIPPEWLGETRCLVLEIDLRFLWGQDAIEELLRYRVVNRLHE